MRLPEEARGFTQGKRLSECNKGVRGNALEDVTVT